MHFAKFFSCRRGATNECRPVRGARMLAVAAMTSSLALSPSLAQPAKVVNGCGPDGILGRIVPDSIRVGNCELEKACNAHDICYGRCLEGGDLHGNRTCDHGEARDTRRLACDDALFAAINSANDNRLACRAVARLYKSFVRTAGSHFFFGIRAPRYTKEELYRVPQDFIEGGGFASEFGVQVEGKLEKNYAAVDALLHYVESNPEKLTEAEIESALDSIETNAMRTGFALEFKSEPSGAELILKPVRPDPDEPVEDVVIWRGGR